MSRLRFALFEGFVGVLVFFGFRSVLIAGCRASGVFDVDFGGGFGARSPRAKAPYSSQKGHEALKEKP